MAVTKKTTKKKAAEKAQSTAAISRPEPAGSGKSPRRGRPVSVGVLQRKLDAATKSLERKRRITAELKQKLASDVPLKRRLKAELNGVKAELSRIKEKAKQAQQDALKAERMERAEAQAVAKFVEKWRKGYVSTLAKKQPRRRKRGRPKKS